LEPSDARGKWAERWLPAAMMMLVSVISYVDRNTLALLSPSVLRDTHLSTTEYGLAVSAYSIAFMIGNPIWGRILDRIGLRTGMIAAVALWTLASCAHAFAAGFWGFALARAMLGLGEGAAAPGGLRTVMQTLPASSRSRGIALTYSGGSAGAILTPLLITPVAARFGWHGAFWFTGAIGALWILGFLGVSRRGALRGTPGAQRAASNAERPRFGDPRLWGFLLGYALGALPLGFVVYCSALYLNRVLGASQATIGSVLWVPPLGSELGIFFWGYAADRLSLRSSKLDVVRRLLPLAMVLSLPLALVPYSHSLPLALAQFFFAMFVAAAFQLLLITYGSEVFSREHAGYVGGIASGAYGAGLALLMPLFGKLFDLGSYAAAFGVAALCPVLGYGCYRWCDAQRSSAVVASG
jgi:ACS family hexuronate transporter-like MFS transporter